MEQGNLYSMFAASYVRGEAREAQKYGGRILSEDNSVNGKKLNLADRLLKMRLDELTEEETLSILKAGESAGLKLYRFKKTHEHLPRVKRVLGYLKGQDCSSVLDIGSGRGVFLWPFLYEFPWVDTLCIDVLEYRVAFLQKVALGGMNRLHAAIGNLCNCPEIEDKSRDYVIMLEVLEHIPDTAAALASAVRIARKGLVISVPNQPDNNPEHIHLFSKSSMTEALNAAGCRRLSFDAVPGHMLVFAQLEG